MTFERSKCDGRPYVNGLRESNTRTMNSITFKLTAFATAAGLARRYYRNWGATKDECQTPLPGDEMIPDPAIVSTESVWIDATPEVIWQWLVQIGQDRAGLYSYQTLENLVGLDIRNADRIHPEWQQLEVGDVVRLVPKGWLGMREGLALPVAESSVNRYIVLREATPEMPWDAVWSFHIVPHWEDRCRLIVRSRQRRRSVADVIGAELCAPVTALMTRKMLLGIKFRAEKQHSDSTTACTEKGAHRPKMQPGTLEQAAILARDWFTMYLLI